MNNGKNKRNQHTIFVVSKFPTGNIYILRVFAFEEIFEFQ